MSERIVLFGGTFDPIHHGHLIVARAVAEYFHFPRVTFVPVAAPPHKHRPGRPPDPPGGAPAPPGDRLKMVRLAIEGERLFDVSDIELRRPLPSYTFDTLLELRREHGLEARLYWIIGADMLEDLPTWHRASEVVDMATIITASRPPYSARLERTLERLRERFGVERAARLAGGVAPTPIIDISSTQIRRRLREGRSIRYLTPPAVVKYIRARRLYLPGDARGGE